jgi:hypothetical protein
MKKHSDSSLVMKKDSDSRKKKYFPPKATKLTEDQAKQFVKEWMNQRDREAEDLLNSLRQEQSSQTEQRRKTS